MSLVRVVFGGHIMDQAGGVGVPIEEWSNSVSLIGPVDPDVEAVLGAIAGAVETYISAPETNVHNTVYLEWCKVNEFDVATGHQITDPTAVHVYADGGVAGGGGGTPHPAVTTSYRVSAEALGRARTGKGGWFVPRTKMTIQENGRFAQSEVDDALAAAVDFMGGLTSATYQPGIWSRKLNSISAIAQLRIGDVPDNISRRKNDMRETYTTSVLP